MQAPALARPLAPPRLSQSLTRCPRYRRAKAANVYGSLDTPGDVVAGVVRRVFDFTNFYTGYNLSPRDLRANWIDSLKGVEYREATEAYHLGQSSRWMRDDRSAEEVLGH